MTIRIRGITLESGQRPFKAILKSDEANLPHLLTSPLGSVIGKT